MVPSYFTTVLVDVPSKRPSALKEKRYMCTIMMEEEIIVVSAVCSFLLPSHCQSFVLCCVHSLLLVVGWFSGGFVGLWACFFLGGGGFCCLLLFCFLT